jgi:hypothetical protein
MYRINYWEDYVGSLFTTGLTIDAVWNTMSLLGHKFKNIPWHKFLDYLEGCRGSIGSFHHNRRQFGSDPGEKGAVGVQNTSAIALFLMEFALAQAATLRHPVLKHRSAAYRNLQNYQMKDGLWSYMFAFDRQSCDMMHHCLVLYYLAKAAATAGIKGSVRTTIRRGWQFVRQHLTTDAEGNDCINWSFEVVPKTLFGGNRYDTNAYFLILACVPWLKRLAVISERDIARTDGLVRHLVRHLMEHEGAHPCLKSHEGTEEVLSLLIANLEDSAASRGALMADWVADHLPSTRMFE